MSGNDGYCAACQGGDYAICIGCDAHYMPRNASGLCFDCRTEDL